MNKLAKVICDILSLNRQQGVEDYEDKYEIWEACAEEALASDEAQTIEALATTLERLSWTNYFLAREPKWKPTHKHYKGKLVRFLAVASEVFEDKQFVVYDEKSGETWCRPIDEFYGYAEDRESANNQGVREAPLVKRFEPIVDVEADDDK